MNRSSVVPFDQKKKKKPRLVFSHLFSFLSVTTVHLLILMGAREGENCFYQLSKQK